MNALQHIIWKRTGPWILYDGQCRLCCGLAARFGGVLRRRNFRLAPLQGQVGHYFTPGEAHEMKLVTRHGEILGGAEAVAHIAAAIWWAAPLGWMWHFKPLRPLLKAAYRFIAARRHCGTASCPVPDRNH